MMMDLIKPGDQFKITHRNHWGYEGTYLCSEIEKVTNHSGVLIGEMIAFRHWNADGWHAGTHHIPAQWADKVDGVA